MLSKIEAIKANNMVTSTPGPRAPSGTYPTTCSSIYPYATSLKPPVKLDFPRFSGAEGEDPINFIERCEEFLALSLSSVLNNTAKD